MNTKPTLYNLLRSRNQQGFVLAVGYYLELVHDSAGMLPIVESDSGQMVIATDINLLKRVCRTLPPRKFKLGIQLVYINSKTGRAYSILGYDKRALIRATPFQSLTDSRFRKLSKKRGAFKWCSQWPSGLVEEISIKDFQTAINFLPQQ
ncbi:MAG: hypothetical protein WC711_03345 [Candidatus Staskawiczbacteria bacterium]|jgi:hypothetical protein